MSNDSSINIKNIKNKENYYDYCRQNLNSNELKAHLLAWSIPELDSAQDGNGGLSTIFTEISELGNFDNKNFYTVEVKRVYENRFGAYGIIPSV